MTEHLSHEDLLHYLYGGEAPAHLAGCPECRALAARMESIRAASAAPPEVSNDFLAAQRRAIYTRMGERPRPTRAWIPAVAAAALVLVGLYIRQPHASVKPAQPEIGDAQLFSEIVKMEQTAEPLAAEPIVALFAEEGTDRKE